MAERKVKRAYRRKPTRKQASASGSNVTRFGGATTGHMTYKELHYINQSKGLTVKSNTKQPSNVRRPNQNIAIRPTNRDIFKPGAKLDPSQVTDLRQEKRLHAPTGAPTAYRPRGHQPPKPKPYPRPGGGSLPGLNKKPKGRGSRAS